MVDQNEGSVSSEKVGSVCAEFTLWALNASTPNPYINLTKSVCVDSNNDVIIAGNFAGSSVNFGNTSLNSVDVSTNIGDGFLAKLDNTVSIENVEKILINIYPNPSNDRLKIISEEKVTSYCIFELSGRIIQQQLNNDKEFTITLNSIASGAYLISLETEKGRAVKKFIIQ